MSGECELEFKLHTRYTLSSILSKKKSEMDMLSIDIFQDSWLNTNKNGGHSFGAKHTL